MRQTRRVREGSDFNHCWWKQALFLGSHLAECFYATKKSVFFGQLILPQGTHLRENTTDAKKVSKMSILALVTIQKETRNRHPTRRAWYADSVRQVSLLGCQFFTCSNMVPTTSPAIRSLTRRGKSRHFRKFKPKGGYFKHSRNLPEFNSHKHRTCPSLRCHLCPLVPASI